MRGKKCCNCGQDFLLLLCGGFMECQQAALADNLAFCPAPPLVLSLREAVLCPQLTNTTLTPCRLRRAQGNRSPCEQHGMSLQAWDVCVYTPQSYAGSVIWSHKWSSTVNHSLNYHCVIHWISKSTVCRGRKSFEIQKSTLVKGVCLTETDRTLNNYYFCYFSLKANSKVSTTWIRLITAVEKFFEGLYFTFNLLIWFPIYLCDKAAVGGRGKSWYSWVASWHWWPACSTWPALTPAASQ